MLPLTNYNLQLVVRIFLNIQVYIFHNTDIWQKALSFLNQRESLTICDNVYFV